MTARKKIGFALAGAAIIGGAVIAPAQAATLNTGIPIMYTDADVDNPKSQDFKGGCTLAAVGTDQDDKMLGLTAGHCTETVGDKIYMITQNGNIEVGKTVYTTGAPWANPDDPDDVSVD